MTRVQLQHLVPITASLVLLILFLHFFRAFKVVLLGFLGAACLASALQPLVRRLPGPRPLKGLLIGLVPPLFFSGLLVLLLFLLSQPLQRQLGQLPEMLGDLNSRLAALSSRLGVQEPVRVQDIGSQALGLVTGSEGQQIFSTTTSMLSMSFVALAFLFIGSIFMLVSPISRLLPSILKLLPDRLHSPTEEAFRDLTPRLRWWVIGTLVSCTTIGAVSWLGYGLVGLKFTGPLALLAGIGQIVPTVGPLVTFLVALVFASLQGMGQVLGATAVYIGVQAVESYLLTPMVMKQAVNIPPLVSLFTIVFWGIIFGLPGLLLAIPLDLVVWIFLNHLVQGEEFK